MKRPAGSAKLVRATLGRYPALTLAEARRKAQEALATLAQGIMPGQAAARRRAAEEAQRRRLFASVAEDFIAEYLPRLRSGRSVEARIRNKLVPR